MHSVPPSGEATAMTEDKNKVRASPAWPADKPTRPPGPRCRKGGSRDDALERYARAHGMNMDEVLSEMERCLAEGGSMRRFFEPD